MGQGPTPKDWVRNGERSEIDKREVVDRNRPALDRRIVCRIILPSRNATAHFW
jgi:hypothetical protein